MARARQFPFGMLWIQMVWRGFTSVPVSVPLELRFVQFCPRPPTVGLQSSGDLYRGTPCLEKSANTRSLCLHMYYVGFMHFESANLTSAGCLASESESSTLQAEFLDILN